MQFYFQYDNLSIWKLIYYFFVYAKNGMHCEAATCNIGTSYVCWFESWLSNFCPTFLLMTLEKQKMAQVVWPLTHVWQTQIKLLTHGFSLAQYQHCSYLVSDTENGRFLILSLLSVTLTFQSEETDIFKKTNMLSSFILIQFLLFFCDLKICFHTLKWYLLSF